MRLTDKERRAIKAAVRKHFGEEARVLLFGSRADDAKRGGDIDLLVEVPGTTSGLIPAKLKTMADIQIAIGDQKIDIVLSGTGNGDVPLVVKIARETGIEL